MFKNRRFLISVFVGIVTIAAMVWYVNTYIYKFLAAFPKVSVEVKPYALRTDTSTPPQAITTVKPDQEFNVRVTIANQNIDGLDLYLSYDKSKVAYFNDYAQTLVPGGGYTQFPDQYFTSPVIENITTVGDKKTLRLVLMSVTTERKNLIQLNFKFKAIAEGDAVFTLESKSEIVGVDSTNNVGSFEKDPAIAIGKVTIQSGSTSITPSVVVSQIISPSAAPTPPWVNPSTTTTRVWGIVQTVDDDGKVIDNAYWRKDSTICPNGTYSNSSATNVNGVLIDKCYSSAAGEFPYFATEVDFTSPKDSKNIWDLVKPAPGNIYPWTNGGPTASWESYVANYIYICNTKYCWVYSKNESKWNNGGEPFDMQTNPEYTGMKASTAATGGPTVGVLPWSNNGPTAAWTWYVKVGDRELTETVICNGNYCWRYLRYPDGETGSAWRDGGNAIYLPTFGDVWKDTRVAPLWSGNGLTVAWTDPVNRHVTLCNKNDCRSMDNKTFTWRFNGEKIQPFPPGGEVTEYNSAWTDPVTNIIKLCVKNNCWDYNIATSTYSTSSVVITPGTSGTSRNITYELKNLPDGYECAGFERRLRKKSDGSPVTDAKGTGCNTGDLTIDIQPATSQFENSHFIWFKIKKNSTNPQIPTPITGTPSGNLKLINPHVTMKVRFQGINNPKPQNNKLLVDVGLWSNSSNQKVEFTYQSNGVWVGSFDLKNIYESGGYGPYYTFFIKGPKHIKKKICDMSPSESIPGTYKCKYGNIQFKEGENELDFTKIILLAGDLPTQDGIVNSLDFAFIRQNFGSTDAEVLLRGDLNLDGIIHTDDHTLIKTALEFKYDDE
jgi:hypothetical protein